jgi:hypothetical protein
MVRPRWHDALIVAAIVALFVVGVWSLWWEDVQGLLQRSPPDPGAAAKGIPAQT